MGNTPTDHAWTFEVLLILAVVGGIAGGISELLARIALGEREIRLYGARAGFISFLGCLVVHAVVGIAGAAAVVFVFSSTTWFPVIDGPQNRIWLLALAVMGGFGARRFLPLVTRQLEKEMEKLKREVEENEERVTEVADRSDGRYMLARAMALLDAGAATTSIDLNSASLEVSAWLRKHPKDRSAAIIESRLSRAVGKLNDGIQALTNFIDAKRQNKEFDRDYADCLYQRSCYKCLAWAKDKSPDTLASGLSDLKESVKYHSSNAAAALEDIDFAEWKENAEFRQITSSTVTTSSRS
jgi:hypothetical protein